MYKIQFRQSIAGLVGLGVIIGAALLTFSFAVSAQPTPASQMAALAAPSVEPVPMSVVRDAEALSNVAASRPDATDPGEIDLSSLRVLAANANGTGLAVAAGATKSGNVCVFIIDGAEGCLTAFEGSTSIGWNILRAHPSDPVIVIGVAPDTTTSVAVNTSAGNYSASVEANTFAVMLPATVSVSEIKSLDVNGTDGNTTITIAPVTPRPGDAK
jgi:hypothetical protein